MRIPVAPNSETASNVQPAAHQNHWTEKDVILITYGNSILPASESADKQPLSILKDFLDNYTNNTINSVHILPFFPYCSDDGFAVMDFMAVNNALGDWQDIADDAESRLRQDYKETLTIIPDKLTELDYYSLFGGPDSEDDEERQALIAESQNGES